MSDRYNTKISIVPPRNMWASYAAATWAFMFATMSFYSAIGGTTGVATLSPEIVAMDGNPRFTLILWETAIPIQI